MNEQGWKIINFSSAIYKNLQDTNTSLLAIEDLIKYNEGLLIVYDDVDANIPLKKIQLFIH